MKNKLIAKPSDLGDPEKDKKEEKGKEMSTIDAFSTAFENLDDPDKYRVAALITDLGTSFIPAVSIAGDVAVTGANFVANMKDDKATAWGTAGEAAFDIAAGAANAFGAPSFMIKLSKSSFRHTVATAFRLLKPVVAASVANTAMGSLDIFDKDPKDLTVDDLRKVSVLVGGATGSLSSIFMKYSGKRKAKELIKHNKSGGVTPNSVENIKETRQYDDLKARFGPNTANRMLGLPSTVEVARKKTMLGNIRTIIGSKLASVGNRALSVPKGAINSTALRGTLKGQFVTENEDIRARKDRKTMLHIIAMKDLDLPDINSSDIQFGSNSYLSENKADIYNAIGKKHIVNYDTLAQENKYKAVENFVEKEILNRKNKLIEKRKK